LAIQRERFPAPPRVVRLVSARSCLRYCSAAGHRVDRANMSATTPHFGPRRTTQVKRGASGSPTAAAIREAAMYLFADRGYEITTMKAIADRVGVRPSAIYNHVDSKQTLLRDIAQFAIKTLINNTHIAIASTDDVGEQLVRAVAAHVEMHTKDPALALIANRDFPSLEEPALTEQVVLRQEYVSIFERVIVRGVAQQRFQALTPRITAYAILQMGIGVSVWFHEDGPLSAQQICDLYGRLALRMVGAGD
jgi:AcrR family transcriptional regulator